MADVIEKVMMFRVLVGKASEGAVNGVCKDICPLLSNK
jgi:hypothetical protein